MFTFLLTGAAIASASSGVITRAEANSEWTQGSIAGSIAWTGCEHPSPMPPNEPPNPGSEPPGHQPPPPTYVDCTWTPYATVGASSAEGCSNAERQLPHLGDQISRVWSDVRVGIGSASFDLPVIALDGSPFQLLCLSVLEMTHSAQAIPCAPPGEPLPPGWHCPYVEVAYFYPLASSSLALPLAASGVPQAVAMPDPVVLPDRKKKCRTVRGSRRARAGRCGRSHKRSARN